MEEKRDVTHLYFMGNNINKTKTLAKIFTVLDGLGIDAEMVTSTTANEAIWIVIHKKDATRALVELHTQLILSNI